MKLDIELPLQMANRITHLREVRDALKAKYEQAIEEVDQAERDLADMLRKYSQQERIW